MISFLNFIEEDIEMKKNLLSTSPTKTKRDIKKFNEKIDSIEEKYIEYKAAVKKYIDTKSKSFNVKNTEKNIDKLNETVSNLEHVKFILNPSNTCIEKIGFDNLLYEIGNYYNFDFDSLNDIINSFLVKFEQAGIRLVSSDFDYTCYVNEYMTAFLEARNSGKNNYDQVAQIFEKIYWINPEIIQHTQLNFIRLIKKYKKEFNEYISNIQKKVMSENNITSYEDCLNKLKDAYAELNEVDGESISDIIRLAKNGEIDMNNYFEGSKFRTAAYSSLLIDPSKIEDKAYLKKFYDNLRKLKNNIEEYINYNQFMPLIDNFKNEYAKELPNLEAQSSTKNNSNNSKSLKETENNISAKEAKLDKLNKKIFGGEPTLFNFRSENSIKQMKLDSVKLAKELYVLYKIHEQEYFKEKVLAILNNSLTVSDLLHLYYSFDYYKKTAVQTSFNTNVHDEIVKYSEEFDLFAMNPSNMIINGVNVFEESDVAKIIINKYRLDNINLNEESLNPDDLETLLNKILFLLRIEKIENSSTSVEKIWFMAQVEKINKLENKKV